MDMEKLIGEIIAPSDYQYRNGFNNIPLVDKLTDNEKRQLEDALIYTLLFETDKEIDTLIVETLVYMKSKKSLPILENLLKSCKDEMVKLIIATSIFEINPENDMIDI